jgi:prepilin-type N-terminal cleavage/methylation domain-containing protein
VDKYEYPHIILFSGGAMKSHQGFAFIETIVALALLGIVAVIFLGSVGTATKATIVTDEQATAESLARSEIEYIKSCAYQYSPTEYLVNPTLSIPTGWSMPNPTAEALHGTDDGIQKVTITVERDGEEKLSALIYKVNR